MPSEEESPMAFLLDSATADAVSDLEQFDVLDELDLLEQGEDFRVAVNSSESQSDTNVGRQKRGIERRFLCIAIVYNNYTLPSRNKDKTINFLPSWFCFYYNSTSSLFYAQLLLPLQLASLRPLR